MVVWFLVSAVVYMGLPLVDMPPMEIGHQTDRWLRYREPAARETLRICAEDIRVEMPEAFCFDPVRNAMLRATEAFVELLGPEIHTWDDELISAFVGIRKRLRAHLASPAACAIEDIGHSSRSRARPTPDRGVQDPVASL